jgi:hypothetical protein
MVDECDLLNPSVTGKRRDGEKKGRMCTEKLDSKIFQVVTEPPSPESPVPGVSGSGVSRL